MNQEGAAQGEVVPTMQEATDMPDAWPVRLPSD
jgi:hypothetical protein